MEERINEFVTRFQEANSAMVEYPVDPLQLFIAKLILASDFDGKKSAKEICEFLLDKYHDVWYCGMALIKNVLVTASAAPGSILSRDSHLLRILKVMEDNKITPAAAVKRVFLVLEKVKRPTSQLPEQELCLASFGEKKLSAYRIQFKNAWTEFLRCCSAFADRELLIKLLRTMPDTVMPHIANSEIFASFFCDCFNRSDDIEVALLSVSGLFHLVSKNNLGEPDDLYSRLYQLISPESMKKSTQSNRVFQLMVKVLRSPMMPARLVPLFAKKMLRVAVIVNSPSMTLWLVVAAFNLMQGHPLVSKPLIHREDVSEMGTADPFDLECKDIDEMAKIIDKTSLWELELLMQHSDPSVVRMASLFRTNFFSRKAKRIASDDYLLISDEQLLNRERKYGTHTKVKKMKADYELDNIVGDDSAKNDVSIPMAVIIPENRGALVRKDTDFLADFKVVYSQ